MVFVTADNCRAQLEELTRLLVSVFPGSTIYQHADLTRVANDVLHNNVDAVFLEVDPQKENSLHFVQMLRRQKAKLPVFLLSQTKDLREEALRAGANDCFVRPVTGQQLKAAMESVKKTEENV